MFRAYAASIGVAAKQILNAILFLPFFIKVNILFGFLLVGRKGTVLMSFGKAKWHNWTFEVGDTCSILEGNYCYEVFLPVRLAKQFLKVNVVKSVRKLTM